MRLPDLGGTRSRVRAHARALGMTYVGEQEWTDESRPAGGADRHEVVRTSSGDVEIGNLGTKYWLNTADLKPGRRGYVAVRHGLVLPHFYARSRDIGALTVKNLAMAGVTVGATIVDMWTSVPTTRLLAGSAYADFRKDAEPVQVPENSRLQVWSMPGGAAATTALLTPAAVALLDWFVDSFDVESHRGTLYAYSNYGDLATPDEQIWDWAFTAASGLAELARLWGAGASFGADWPQYTPDRMARPEQLDGALSFLRGKR